MNNNIEMLRKLSLEALRLRILRAPDFGWDDEGVELRQRGYKCRWRNNDKELTLIKI